MNQITVHIVNAFTDGNIGGNPAGVVLNAESFDTTTKQAIAAKLGLSETAFVETRDEGFGVTFFTPNKQVPDCGHATVATFSFLHQQGVLTSQQTFKELVDGSRRDISFYDGKPFMEQRKPVYTTLTEEGQTAVLKSLHLTPADLIPNHVPIIVNTGVNFMLIPVKDSQTLRTIQPNFDAVEQISQHVELIGYYAFALDASLPTRHATARMFAPLYDIPEESATGMAAGPLAAYLYDKIGIKETDLVIEQGHLMPTPSPSEILAVLQVEDGHVSGLQIGGSATVMSTERMEFVPALA